ncbi:hypothetical protein OG21DRAFT_447840 [Imleria badia]|nr:hypothetical protein OG21DRAFT_447840 [Imleria badia]
MTRTPCSPQNEHIALKPAPVASIAIPLPQNTNPPSQQHQQHPKRLNTPNNTSTPQTTQPQPEPHPHASTTLPAAKMTHPQPRRLHRSMNAITTPQISHLQPKQGIHTPITTTTTRRRRLHVLTLTEAHPPR